MAAVATNPPVAANALINPADGPYITFPPFPALPAGMGIMSFKEFKERGICMEPGPDDAEVDALGIPTIPLIHPHKDNMCKTNTKRKRKAEEATARKKAGLPASRVPWYEQWEDWELVRFSHGFNPNSSRFERIHAAAGDFANGRVWPTTFVTETGPKFIWERYQRYIGIQQGTMAPKEKEKDKKDAGDDEMSDDDMDDDEGEEVEESVGGLNSTSNGHVVNDRDLPALVAKNKAAATNEENLSRFFDSPERSTKVFLSSYAREKGFLWSDINLECMPRILSFFFRFLIRSKVLPENERSLRRSIEVVTLAQTELPNCSALAKVFPDVFSKACTKSWGSKKEPFVLLNVEGFLKPLVDAAPDEPTESEEDKAIVPAAEKEPSGWDTPGWGSTTENDAAPWGTGGWSNVEKVEPDPVDNWTLPEVKGHSEMGLESFPSTHRTGIVETSTRCIKAIIGPNSNPPPKPPQAEGATGLDADGVEIDLDANFTKVVFAPMPVDWDGGECPVYSKPTILSTSQGAVVSEPTGPSKDIPASASQKPYDPLNDDITLLIESNEAQVALLREGMLIGGTWVQIVRQEEAAKKKKKGKSKKAAPVYWYLEEVTITAPSFWAVAASDSEPNKSIL